MNMIQVINGEIKQYNLPKTGTLKDGATVSGYNLLDAVTLKNEGWLPLEDNPPEYNNETQYIVHDGYEIQEDKVIKKYKVENIPPIDINNSKNDLIALSKTKLTNYLQNNPLLFSDGKYYSVTQEKQNLLNNAITIYQMKTQLGLPAELKWNSTGEECSVWVLEEIIPLALGVAGYVEPLVAYQQSIEVQIRNCTTKEDLDGIVIDYATV